MDRLIKLLTYRVNAKIVFVKGRCRSVLSYHNFANLQDFQGKKFVGDSCEDKTVVTACPQQQYGNQVEQ